MKDMVTNEHCIYRLANVQIQTVHLLVWGEERQEMGRDKEKF